MAGCKHYLTKSSLQRCGDIEQNTELFLLHCAVNMGKWATATYIHNVPTHFYVWYCEHQTLAVNCIILTSQGVSALITNHVTVQMEPLLSMVNISGCLMTWSCSNIIQHFCMVV